MATLDSRTISQTGTPDYSTPQAWEDDAPADLVTADVIWQGVIQSASDGFIGTSRILIIAGSTSDNTRYKELTVASGASFIDNIGTGPLRYDESNGAFLRVTGTQDALRITESWARIRRLQITSNDTGATTATIRLEGDGSFADKSIVVNHGTLRTAQVTGSFSPSIKNSLIISRNSSGAGEIVLIGQAGSLYNCTIAVPDDLTSATNGLSLSGTPVGIVSNCAVFGVTNFLDTGGGSMTFQSNYTDDSSPPFAGITTADYSTSTGSMFENITDGTHDYRTKIGSVLIDNGTTDATNASEDIFDVSRPKGAAYDVGAVEFSDIIVDGTESNINISGQTGSVEIITIIDGSSGNINISGGTGQIILPSIISGSTSNINISGATGTVLLNNDITLPGISGNIDISGTTGSVIAPSVVIGTAGNISISGETGSILISSIINGSVGNINISGGAGIVRMTQSYPDWAVDQNAIRCILVEVDVDSTTRYLSSRPFVSGSSDTPSNTVYEPIVVGSSVDFVERMSVVDATASLSFGDIEIENLDGSRDDWLEDVWTNRDITVLHGDVRWPRADFQELLIGTVGDIGSRSRGKLNLKLRDKLQLLNTPVTEDTLGGSTNNKDQLKPLTFGECHNVYPLLTNPATLEYQWHNGAAERLIEVRDDGVPVGKSTSLGSGTFTLSAAPFGTITASVQGDDNGGTWSATAKQIIERLVTGFGENPFSAGDLDSVSLSTFDAANPQKLGVYLSNRENLLSLCNDIAATVGARVVMTRGGQLRLIKIDLPASGTATNITTDDIINNSLRIKDKIEVIAGVKLGYAKNWTVQDNLDTRIPNAHKDLYAREWLTSTKRDSTVSTSYRIDSEPVQRDTFFLTATDADAEAQRILDLFKVPRFIVELEGHSSLMTLELGQALTITHDRFGMSGGKSGMVVGLSPKFDSGTIKVEVFV